MTAEITVMSRPTRITWITEKGSTRSGSPPEPVMALNCGTTSFSVAKRAMPTTIPMALASSPTIVASRSTARRTCLPLAPTARSSANSRSRWVTTMVKVL